MVTDSVMIVLIHQDVEGYGEMGLKQRLISINQIFPVKVLACSSLHQHSVLLYCLYLGLVCCGCLYLSLCVPGSKLECQYVCHR